MRSPISGLLHGPRLGDELYAVRFPHPTGLVFGEPLPLAMALQVLTQLKIRGLAAKLLPADASEVAQALILHAEPDDRVIVLVPVAGHPRGIAQIAFARVPCDIVMPELGPRPSLALDLSPESIAAQVAPGEEVLSTRPVAYVGWQLLVMTGRAVVEIASSVLCEVTVRVATSRVRRASDVQRT